jgi:putative glutathione S-transferase
MGYLLNGKWTEGNPPAETGNRGTFDRIDSMFRHRVTADGSSGFKAEAGRYHLYVAHNCPWAHRTLIYRAIKKLDHAISISAAIPGIRTEGWTFESNPEFPDCIPDTLYGFRYLHQLYSKSNPSYTGKVTVPVLWDKRTEQIVNNESSEIIRMLNSEFRGIAGDETDYYPERLRPEIDRINDIVYANINNGVYRCGFAKSQAAYDEAFDKLFTALDKIEVLLTDQPWLVGGQVTEADWRLFPTLLRFDVVYFSLFKCNKKRIADYPALSRYMHRLLAVAGVAPTVNARYYVLGYYSNTNVNPTGIIPRGTPVDFAPPEKRSAA